MYLQNSCAETPVPNVMMLRGGPLRGNDVDWSWMGSVFLMKQTSESYLVCLNPCENTSRLSKREVEWKRERDLLEPSHDDTMMLDYFLVFRSMRNMYLLLSLRLILLYQPGLRQPTCLWTLALYNVNFWIRYSHPAARILALRWCLS